MTVTDGRRQTHVNEQFFFVHFRLRPKNAIPGPSIDKAQEVVLELPRKLVEDWKAENPDQDVTDKSIAAEIARVVAIESAFPGAKGAEFEFDEPNWLEQRAPVMNARACDYHDNGIRAWLLRSSDKRVSSGSFGAS
jgi:hypothetical protein